jgi:hypothetical protein
MTDVGLVLTGLIGTGVLWVGAKIVVALDELHLQEQQRLNSLLEAALRPHSAAASGETSGAAASEARVLCQETPLVDWGNAGRKTDGDGGHLRI